MAPTLLLTPRLRLLAPAESQAGAVLAYEQRNAAHLAPWDPPPVPGHGTLARTQAALAAGRAAFEGGLAHRWWLAPADAEPAGPLHVIGSVHLSGIVRGAFHNAALGYNLDAACQGLGLMNEALQAVLAEAFGPRINLHRVQAAVRPENHRSLAVVRRLGFVPEGLARQYLYIDHAWRDHLLFVRLNPAFVPPAHWQRP